ncbi:MAG: hypothetical protein ABL901_01125 [Hyphomicrobiaceae bacterium]
MLSRDDMDLCDSPMGAPPGPRNCTVEYVDETPRRARRTDDEIKIEAALDHHWVTLLSVERPAQRFLGDNRGMLPVWVESNADWRQSGVAFDRQQPVLRAVRLVVMGVKTVVRANALKSALDEAMHGRELADDADPLRHRFRNGIDFGDIDVWWTPLLQDALGRCEQTAQAFDLVSRAEHDRMMAAIIADANQRRAADAARFAAKVKAVRR